ncbi:unnamed protein product [Trichobilharzia szidati]|nr:unnamed protein product [Trichobilharzia szidati]
MFKYNEEGLRKQKELERQIKSGKVKVLRKSDLKSQSLPPPEVLEDVERTLKPSQVKQEEDAPKAKSIKTNKETNRKTDTREDGLLSQPRLSMSLPPSLKSWLIDDWDLITRQARLYELPASQPIYKRMSDIYGSIHLLRLFVKLRDTVSCVRVDEHSLPMLEALVAEFLQFLQENESRYFRIEDYSVATAEYQRRAMC